MNLRVCRVCFVTILCACAAVFAESEPLRGTRPLPTPQNAPADAQQLLTDNDGLVTEDAILASDRQAMAAGLTSNANLHDDVVQFFRDRDQAANFELNLFNDRVRLRRDIGYAPAPLFRSPQRQGISIDVTNYFKAYDARVAADAAILNDLQGMRSGIAVSDSAAITSNANAFFLDRHSLAQARNDEAAAIGAMRKDLNFRLKTSVTKPSHTGLSDHVSRYLSDRTQWLTAGQLVNTDRNNLRAALGTASLETVARTFLTDHHQLFADEVQLALDRDIMRLDVRYKLARRAQNFFGSIFGHGSSKEDVLATEDIDQDVSADNVGEK